jgi:predicted metal-dependent phosphoesterase TrpH
MYKNKNMKCDLHIHTSYSYDSPSPPQEMIRAALRKGIDCIAICDHGQTKGAIEAINLAVDLPILIVPGIEIKSKEGDILGLNIKKIIPNGLSAKETIKIIKEEGGVAVIPHPFGFNCAFRGELRRLIDIIDGVEVLNASIFNSNNKKALAFAREYDLPITAGSDAHSPGFLGRAYLEIPGKNLSLEEVFKKIKNKNVKVKGRETNFFEKVVDHSMRNIIKFDYYVVRKKK